MEATSYCFSCNIDRIFFWDIPVEVNPRRYSMWTHIGNKINEDDFQVGTVVIFLWAEG